MSRPALRNHNAAYPKQKAACPKQAPAKKPQPNPFCLGDRVAVRMDAKTLCSGDVRYVGPSGGRVVVGTAPASPRSTRRPRHPAGIRLDDYRPGLGDGKRSSGERHFRCEAGHAIFASPSQCQLLRKAPPPEPPKPPEQK